MTNPKDHCNHHATEIVSVKQADAEHLVLSTVGRTWVNRRTPCAQCPWRKDADGVFPPEAFRESAATAYDQSTETFGCHDSGIQRPAVCAGFLLRGAENNRTVRLAKAFGIYDGQVQDLGLELHESYRAMAIANGVDPDDSTLQDCRD